jgi:hypothetical protein
VGEGEGEAEARYRAVEMIADAQLLHEILSTCHRAQAAEVTHLLVDKG